MNMLQLFKPGDAIYGFCNGYFGRDDYETKTCVAVRPKYALFEYEDGTAAVLNNSNGSLQAALVDAWKKDTTE